MPLSLQQGIIWKKGFVKKWSENQFSLLRPSKREKRPGLKFTPGDHQETRTVRLKVLLSKEGKEL